MRHVTQRYGTDKDCSREDENDERCSPENGNDPTNNVLPSEGSNCGDSNKINSCRVATTYANEKINRGKGMCLITSCLLPDMDETYRMEQGNV